MAIDPKYQDNLIFKKDAYQNLLTNIKNYPVIDIDYMTEADVDERYGDQIWSGYTQDMPCIKITYGDNTSTKGNIIFKEENRGKIVDAKKQIERLTEVKNDQLKQRARWQRIYNENRKIIDEKEALMQAHARDVIASDNDKYNFLIRAYSLLYKWNPNNMSNSVPLISIQDNSDGTTFHESFPDQFTYRVVTMPADEDIVPLANPTEEHTINVGLYFLNGSQTIARLQSNINALKNACINEELFAEDSSNAQLFDSFKEFISYYNTLVFIDGIKKYANIPENYNFFELIDSTVQYSNEIRYYTESDDGYAVYQYTTLDQWKADRNNGLLYIFKGNPPIEILDLLNYTQYDPNYDFENFYSNFIDSVENIVNNIIEKVNANLEIINDRIIEFNSNIHWLDTNGVTWEQDEDNNYSLTDYTAPENYDKTINAVSESLSIGDYNKFVELLEEQLLIAASTAGPEGADRTLYGYKYVKVGSNITFDDTYYTAISPYSVGKGNTALFFEKKEANEITADTQDSGTFRITINNHIYEVPIKGFTRTTSNEDIFLKTTGTINFLGNVAGSGSIVTNSGNIYAPGGAIAAGTYLAVRGYPSDEDRGTLTGQDNTAVIWYDGGYNKIHITGLDNNGNDIISNLELNGTLVSTNNTTAQDIGTTENPWHAGYFKQITIGTGATAFTLGGSGSSSGTASPTFLGTSGWTNTLSGALTLSGTSGTQLTVNSTANAVTPDSTDATTYNANTAAAISTSGGIYAAKDIWARRVFNAVFNDYAEYRTTINAKAGHCIVDNDDGSLSLSSKRLQPGAQIISDTFGHSMGATETAQTPLAVAGRVLAYTYKDRNEYHAGMAVCSAPNGTIDIMTREEIRDYPDCIVGIVSEIPNYDVWGTDNVKVNGRIWIKVR